MRNTASHECSNSVESPVHAEEMRLQHFPISFFAVPLGLTGFTLAVQKAVPLLGIAPQIATALLWLTIGVSLAIAVAYLAKTIRFTDAVIAEFNHPVRVNFFPIIAKILLVLSVVFLGRSLVVSRYLWFAGTLAQLIFALAVISFWFNHPGIEIKHLSPAWFIPIVGFVIVPIAGVQHGFTEISWFFFSVGIVFWLSLLIIILYRMFFHAPMPQKLMPTMFILFAPPAIGCISWVKLTGGMDPLARILYSFSLFMFALVLMQARRLTRISFFLSWWAYTFPLAALSLATVLVYHETGYPFLRGFFIGQLALLTAITLLLLVRTAVAIAHRHICVLEE